MNHYLDQYAEYLKGTGYSSGAIKNQLFYMALFFSLVEKEIREIKEADAQTYINHLRQRPTEKGKIMSEGSIFNAISALKGFFKFVYAHEYIMRDPLEDMPYPNKRYKYMRGAFTREEMDKILSGIEINGTYGERDRALFELIYSSGLRSTEACSLRLSDMDLKERMLTVRQGKGGKDRYAPFSKTALIFLKLYLSNERRNIVKKVDKEDEDILFLSVYYGKLDKNRVGKLFDKYIKKSGVEKKGRSVHSIRHSTATHLLEAGADVRFVSELLGHESIQTTVIYTHMMGDHLKKAYKSSHPRENRYYEEVDEEYLKEIDKMESDLKRSALKSKKSSFSRKKRVKFSRKGR